ncbi:MAG: tRNA modification GTPase MnmE [Geminicoccaceae bacterium]|nr:MAG: tRNA modification GTPase MnmE [Geminicoccaceae bacterium]
MAGSVGADGGRGGGTAAQAAQREQGLSLDARPATIWAWGTPPGRGAIAVLRISGPASASVVRHLTGRPPPEPRRAQLRTLRDPRSGETIDRALLLWFPGPASYTGEDSLEIHHHGGPAIAAALAAALRELPDTRPAEPGEFTRRAFLNGKLDLAQAEAIDDLVSASARAQLRQALEQARGTLGRRCAAWRAALLDALALLEAELDFAGEEGDVGAGRLEEARPGLLRVRSEMAAALAEAAVGERLREGLTVAVIGPPNAGKSSLVNRLAGREAAIVTPYPGTTRDVIEVALELDGMPVTIVDTAGLRETADPVEAIGIARAKERAERADLALLVLDATAAPSSAEGFPGREGDRLVVVNKVDAAAAPAWVEGRPDALAISCRTGLGFDRLLERLAAMARERLAGGESALITRERHRAELAEARGALDRLLAAPPGTELVLLAEELRLAVAALDRLTGRAGVDAVLDRIFARFCIGK